MYISHLLINVGDNPDQPRPGRLWLRNIYHVHQRLSMAFPSNERKESDVHFLKPFNPEDFSTGQVHVKRNADSGFLFRIDPQLGGRVSILVLSALKPDWDYAFHNAGYMLVAPPETRIFSNSFSEGNMYRFRVRVNLSKKSNEHRKENDKTDKLGRQKSQGKRVALTWRANENPENVITEWFKQKCSQRGFEIVGLKVINLGWTFGNKSDTKSMKFRSALIEGTLKVTNSPRFSDVLAQGIGSAKSFGFGLLSIAPL